MRMRSIIGLERAFNRRGDERARGGCAPVRGPYIDQVRSDGSAFPGLDTSGSIPGPWARWLPGADRILRVSGYAVHNFGTTGVAATITWQYPGTVIALLGHATSGALATIGAPGTLMSLALSLTVGDANENVITNGNAQDFATLFCLHGPGYQPFTLMRKVHQSEIWQAQFRNLSTDTNLTPELVFWFRRKGRGAGISQGEAQRDKD